jgi:hypothetical protein
MTEHYLCRVPPFGNLGVKDRMHLVRAYRSWPRPSSLSGAKASTLHPLLPHQKMIDEQHLLRLFTSSSTT